MKLTLILTATIALGLSVPAFAQSGATTPAPVPAAQADSQQPVQNSSTPTVSTPRQAARRSDGDLKQYGIIAGVVVVAAIIGFSSSGGGSKSGGTTGTR